MNYKRIFKRETKVIAYVVIALTLVVIGSSYALFMQVKNNTDNQVVTAGSLTITYSSSNDVNGQSKAAATTDNSCLKPMTDEDGKNSGCDFKLSITNTGTLPMAYDLLIYNQTATNDATIVDLSNFRYQLNKQLYESEVKVENGVVTNGSSSNPVDVTKTNKTLSELDNKTESSTPTKKILESSVIQPGDTIAFDLKIWIKDEADEEIIGQQVSLKLDVVGVVYEDETLAKTIENLVSSTSTSTTGKVEKFDHTAQTASIASVSENNNLTEYRYTGTNPNNYVYFGCNKSSKIQPDEEGNSITCTNDHLYRIIGVIPTQDMVGGEYVPRVKIIKDSYWKQTANETELTETTTFEYTGEWEASAVYKALNENYWESLDKYQKYVAPSVLYFGAITNDGGYVPDTLYTSERNGDKGILSTVGLLYPSDYGYSLGSSNKNQTIPNNSTSWLKVSDGAQDEWLLTSPGESALTLKTDGTISTGTGSHAIRPSVFLQENVYVSGGTGSKDDPYMLEFR